jgi:hypothetical protein
MDRARSIDIPGLWTSCFRLVSSRWFVPSLPRTRSSPESAGRDAYVPTYDRLSRNREDCQTAPFPNLPAPAVLFLTEHHWKSPRMNLNTARQVAHSAYASPGMLPPAVASTGQVMHGCRPMGDRGCPRQAAVTCIRANEAGSRDQRQPRVLSPTSADDSAVRPGSPAPPGIPRAGAISVSVAAFQSPFRRLRSRGEESRRSSKTERPERSAFRATDAPSRSATELADCGTEDSTGPPLQCSCGRAVPDRTGEAASRRPLPRLPDPRRQGRARIPLAAGGAGSGQRRRRVHRQPPAILGRATRRIPIKEPPAPSATASDQLCAQASPTPGATIRPKASGPESISSVR